MTKEIAARLDALEARVAALEAELAPANEDLMRDVEAKLQALLRLDDAVVATITLPKPFIGGYDG